ncbi:MAG: ABC transporter substrate-binding protein, partial [Planctomycetes bacterium]|nr:ABC transporter substrate-binding protein [Planctomycetota bacterium]
MKSTSALPGLLYVSALIFVVLASIGCAKKPEPPHVIGIVLIPDEFRQPTVDGLVDGLAEFGYVEGRNIEYYIVNAHGDRSALPRLAREVVGQRPAVICAVGGAEAEACVDAARGTGVPVVFMGVSSPVERGLARSLLEPLPNTTGVRSGMTSLICKRMQLAKLFFPEIKSVTVLYDPNSVSSAGSLKHGIEIAPTLGLTVKGVPLTTDEEVSRFMNSVDRKEHEVILATPCVLVFKNRKSVIAPGAIRAGIPFFGFDREACKEGAVLAYGSNFYSFGHQGAALVRKILYGIQADSMPIEMPFEIGLSINLRTAR